MKDYTDYEPKLRELFYYQAQVGEGWKELVKEAYDKIKEKGYVISQIKEKWGGLRIYLWVGDDETWDHLIDIERRSLETCEQCGKPGKERPGGWVKTLCGTCHSKRERFYKQYIGDHDD